MNPSESDLHWTAGFLEGEGCFDLNKGRPRVTASQNIREPLERLQAVFGGCIHQRTRGIYVWSLNSKKDARALMQMLRPLLSWRRQGQIDRALSGADRYEETRPGSGEGNRRKTHCPAGHPYDATRHNADGSFRGRECRRCKNERRRKRYRAKASELNKAVNRQEEGHQ